MPAGARADLESELRSHLDAAAEEGVDAATVVGNDPAGFAREWARARDLVRQRWRVIGSILAALVAAAGWQLVRNVVLGPPGSVIFHAQDGWDWLLLIVAATWNLAPPALVGVAVYLRATRDALTVRTVVLALLASPIAIWVTETAAYRRGGGLGTAYWLPFYWLVLALLIGLVRGGVVAATQIGRAHV